MHLGGTAPPSECYRRSSENRSQELSKQISGRTTRSHLPQTGKSESDSWINVAATGPPQRRIDYECRSRREQHSGHQYPRILCGNKGRRRRIRGKICHNRTEAEEQQQQSAQKFRSNFTPPN